ncbi:MAG: alpha/beta hydrolase [Myxococcaceae bacterium]|nr:alpha/beta hydrolase [Myxococcaceae bacterium]MCI0669264.1 alpha/beta hydrolase [Myxococcaceae bacterium]
MKVAYFPGAGGRASFWEPVARRVGGDALLLGWPGFGDEPMDPTVHSLEELTAWAERRLEGPHDIVAQSMGGVVAVQLALRRPELVRRLVLVATSGGIDVTRLGAIDWRPEYTRSHPAVPRWFVDDRTDVTDRLGEIRAPTLLLWGDADPVSPVAIGEFLEQRIPDAKLVVLSGGTHALAAERPDDVAPLVARQLS